MNKLVELERSGLRIFTAQDLAVVWRYGEERKLFELIKYYVRKKEMFALARGLYSLHDLSEDEIRNDQNLQWRIANRLLPGSYVSLYSVLKNEGVIDQYYNGVYSVGPKKLMREVRGVRFEYRRAKESILWSQWGRVVENGVERAGVARAILDTWYCEPGWEIARIGKGKVSELKLGAKMYSKRIVERVKELERSNDAEY